MVKKPNMMGSIHNIIRFVDSWLGEVAGVMLIFCMKNIDTPTRIGSTITDGSGVARSSHKNFEDRGMMSCTIGASQEYRWRDRSARRSGVLGSVCPMA